MNTETKNFITEQNQKLALKIDGDFEKMAIMVARGFAEVHEKMATKDEMNRRFDLVDQRFDIIEGQLFNHQNQIDYLRDEQLQIKTFVGFPKKA